MILYVLAAAALVWLVRSRRNKRNAVCTASTRLDGKTALITGGTAGIGLHVAIDLARRGARVLIASPFPEEGAAAVKIIIDETSNENVVFKVLNLASLESVRRLSREVVQHERRLDLLINNAGVAARGLCTTRDGLNFIMQVNYFGHFLLTLLLLPLLNKSGTPVAPSRIVNTASVLHRFGAVDKDSLHGTGYVFAFKSYGTSKLALVMFTRSLARRLRGSDVVVNAVDPGAVGSNILYGMSSIVGIIAKFLLHNFNKTPWEGAQTTIHVAMSEAAGAVSGQYFADCGPAAASPRAADDRAADFLWRESVRLVKLTDDEIKLCLGEEHFDE